MKRILVSIAVGFLIEILFFALGIYEGQFNDNKPMLTQIMVHMVPIIEGIAIGFLTYVTWLGKEEENKEIPKQKNVVFIIFTEGSIIIIETNSG
jgi:nitrogen fixation-related uncharacterized protein